MEPSSRTIPWSADALADLDGVWSYYARAAGPDTAEKVAREIYAGVELLADQPFAGRARNEIRAGLRSFVIDPHVIFYRVEQDVPQIVRVLDGRQDIESIFLAARG